MIGANSAAGYQLASGEPVMALGGFNGSDPSPTLAQFQDYVADGEIHYFISGGGGLGGGPGGRRRARWDGRRLVDRHLGRGELHRHHRRRRHRLRPLDRCPVSAAEPPAEDVAASSTW